jgi:ABC-type glycerol-3-phosphate transport system substrate-binding protein
VCHRRSAFQQARYRTLKDIRRRADGRRVTKALTAIALALAAIGFAACGGGGDSASGSSDAEQIRAVIDLGNSKDPAICDKLTAKWMENVVGGDRSDCEQQVEQSSEDAVKVQDVSVDGDHSTVTARIEGDPGTLLLVKQDGEWKLDDIQTK